MRINGFQKLSLLDYPGKTACIIFTQGCNYICSFCHNSGLITHKFVDLIEEEDVLNYLEKRKNLLDGVVISGGEPTIQSDLKDFITKVKNMGYSVKLDTNGSNPDMLKKLLDDNLIDYIAMDIKNSLIDYDVITKIKGVDISKIKKSIKIIQKSNIDHEFRTTIMKNYHDIDKIKEICSYLEKDDKYYLQNFQDSENVLDKTLIEFSKDELKMIEDHLKKDFPNISVRGI